jgi:hypothetical protein
MALSTPRLALPYPVPDDTVDVPRDIQALAVRLDTVTGGLTLSSPVGDVGQVSQARAGRQLAASDFTTLGLSAPRGLWNLSDLTDASGNGRSLANKGAVTFGVGINGAATTAAQFTGSTSQALYIADTGAADPFRIGTGSWGCWFRTAKGALQAMMAKAATGVAADLVFQFYVGTGGVSICDVGNGASVVSVVGVSVVTDDRWHFGVVTYDGTGLRLFVDGVLEGSTATGIGTLLAGSAPLNIGGRATDAGTSNNLPHYGRVDEAFVTADVLSEDQVRSLYAARLVHTLGAQPKTVSLSVRRQRRGAALATTDFSTGPLRLYNLTNGDGSDQGSNNVALAWAGVGSGGIVAGPAGDGTGASALSGGANYMCTDAGLPSALLARSYGCWFKTSSAAAMDFLGWGTVNTADARVSISAGLMYSNSGADLIAGPFMGDGSWHHAVTVEDNTASNGVKRKLYLDGRLVGGSTVLNAITLAGANRFRVGAGPTGANPFTGQVDGAFVTGYAMTTDEVLRLYAKASQTMLASPKNAGDHVEGYDSGSVLMVADTLDAQHYIDLTLA